MSVGRKKRNRVWRARQRINWATNPWWTARGIANISRAIEALRRGGALRAVFDACERVQP